MYYGRNITLAKTLCNLCTQLILKGYYTGRFPISYWINKYVSEFIFMNKCTLLEISEGTDVY